MDEIFDVFDEEMRLLGTASRQEVHRVGHWHQTFHCWVLHRSQAGDFLLLQRRHRTKDTHPNKLDISCAGHLATKESPADGVREIWEELGIAMEFARLHKVGVFQSANIWQDVQDNEFCNVFVWVRDEAALTDYRPALEEVSGLYLIRVEEMERLCRGQLETAPVHGFDLNDAGVRCERKMHIGPRDLVERNFAYYEMLFRKIALL